MALYPVHSQQLAQGICWGRRVSYGPRQASRSKTHKLSRHHMTLSVVYHVDLLDRRSGWNNPLVQVCVSFEPQQCLGRDSGQCNLCQAATALQISRDIWECSFPLLYHDNQEPLMRTAVRTVLLCNACRSIPGAHQACGSPKARVAMHKQPSAACGTTHKHCCCTN